MGPRPFGVGANADQLFATRTRPAFDEFGAAGTLSDLLIGWMLERNRAGRLTAQAAHERGALSLGETIDSIAAHGFRTAPSDRGGALRRAGARAVTDRLIALAADRGAGAEVGAMGELKMGQLGTKAEASGRAPGNETARAAWLGMAADMRRWLDRQE